MLPSSAPLLPLRPSGARCLQNNALLGFLMLPVPNFTFATACLSASLVHGTCKLDWLMLDRQDAKADACLQGPPG